MTLETSPQRQQDGSQIKASSDSNGIERGINLLSIAVKTAAYSALQQPMDGIAQLAGFKAPQWIGEAPSYEFNTPEWYAATVGHGAGFMVPYLVTSKATGAFIKRGGVAKSMLDGAISGFAMTPSKDGEDPFNGRAAAAFNAGVMFGSQHAFNRGLNRGLEAWTARSPQLSEAMATRGTKIATSLTLNTFSGTAAGITSMELTSLVNGNGLVTDKQALLETAVSAAATGFALEAGQRGLAGISGRLPSKPREQPATESDTTPSPALRADVSRVASFNDRPIGESYREVGVFKTTEADPLNGARQYETDSGRTFWQTPDGRILYEKRGKNWSEQHVWTPYGVAEPMSGHTSFREGPLGREVLRRHEPQGFYFDENGRAPDSRLTNEYTYGVRSEYLPELTPALRNQLSLRVPRELEVEALAAMRILPNANGEPYSISEVSVTRQKPDLGSPPKGLSAKEYWRDWTETRKESARTYMILSAEGALELGKLGDDHSANYQKLQQHGTAVIVPERYAQQLDKVRELRRTATLDVREHPELQPEILQARRELFLSPYGDRFMPEHWGQFLDTVPNRALISRIELHDHKAPGLGNNTIADASNRGTIRIYAEHNGVQQHVRQTLQHEWTHLASDQYPDLTRAYESATKLSSFSGRDYARRNLDENWAVHFGEMLLEPNPELFLTLAHRSPVRTVLLAESLRRELLKDPTNAHMNAMDLQARLDYIDQSVLPLARQDMRYFLHTGSAREVRSALEMFTRLSKRPEEVALRDKLFDLSSLPEAVEFNLRKLDEGWNRETARSAIYRAEVLRTSDPAAYARIVSSPEYLQATGILMASHRKALAGRDNGRVGSALRFAESMNELGLVPKLFLVDDLAAVAINHPDSSTARKAFQLAAANASPRKKEVMALEILKSDSAARSAAADVLLREASSDTLFKCIDLLIKQAESGDFRAHDRTSANTAMSLSRPIMKSFLEGKESPDLAARAHARMRLVRVLAQAKPDLFDAQELWNYLRTADRFEDKYAALI